MSPSTQFSSSATRLWPDRIGVWASAACAVHCLLTPLILSFSPVFVHLLPGEETFHRRLAVIVAGSAAAALFFGFRKHRRKRVLLLMTLGLTLIIGTAWWGHLFTSRVSEVGLTMLGSTLLIAAHRMNHTFCRSCECVEHVCEGDTHDHAHSQDHASEGRL